VLAPQDRLAVEGQDFIATDRTDAATIVAAVKDLEAVREPGNAVAPLGIVKKAGRHRASSRVIAITIACTILPDLESLSFCVPRVSRFTACRRAGLILEID
jgi:hypothetical protein